MTGPIVVGGGPAGAAAAIMLAQAGARPVVLERSRDTGDALCGGFLSWRTLERLDALGVSRAALSGHDVRTLHLFAGERRAEAALPGGAIGVSRRRLDTLLIDAAAQAGAAVERGVTVRRIEDTRRLCLSDGATLEPETVFVATGKSDVPGLGRARDDPDPALGLRVRLRGHPALERLTAGSIELHLFPGGYAGLVLQEGGDANLCLAVRKSRLAVSDGDPASLLRQLGDGNPALAERLAFMASMPEIDAIGAVPYGWIARETSPGRYRIGDQAGVIPSLAGEGMGIAVASGAAAAKAWLSGEGAPSFQHRLAGRLARPVGVAATIWRIAESRVGGRVGTAALAAFPALTRLAARATRIGD